MRHALLAASARVRPFLHRVLEDPARPPLLSGDFASWGDAQEASGGYDDRAILDKVRQSSLKVRDGLARGERDGVTFDVVPYSFPVVAALLRAATRNDGVLRVLDFGGSLGSSYFQFRAFGARLRRLEWNVVEQPSFVACGQADFETEDLKFYRSVSECVNARPPDVILLSGVLGYLPEPHALLSQVCDGTFQTVIIDRTLFHDLSRDRLCVQKVPREIYQASYPVWLLSRSKLAAAVSSMYVEVACFQDEHTPEFERVGAKLLGFVFDKRPA